MREGYEDEESSRSDELFEAIKPPLEAIIDVIDDLGAEGFTHEARVCALFTMINVARRFSLTEGLGTMCCTVS